MSDKKKGHLDLRQSVAISRHMRMLGVRLPREWMPPPPEAIRVLVRLRGSKGKEERELLLWVLRVGSGSSAEAKQQSSFQGGANGATYVSGMNRQLRELALVRRSTTHEFSSGVGSPISGPRSPRTVSLHGSGYFPPSTPRVEEPERVFFPEPTPATPQPVAVEPIEKEQVQVQQKEQYTHANTHQVIPVLAQESNGVVKVDMEALMAAEEAAAQPPPPPVAPAMEKISRSASVRWSFKGWGAGKA
ncbi:hypothetical protein DFH27DRAFT_572970 [Peziza echinospora]|nr:hypothetical protein DFH27DRAFT_572970 [Peziza echinospora]